MRNTFTLKIPRLNANERANFVVSANISFLLPLQIIYRCVTFSIEIKIVKNFCFHRLKGISRMGAELVVCAIPCYRWNGNCLASVSTGEVKWRWVESVRILISSWKILFEFRWNIIWNIYTCTATHEYSHISNDLW